VSTVDDELESERVASKGKNTLYKVVEKVISNLSRENMKEYSVS
jgi:hypothetical protein